MVLAPERELVCHYARRLVPDGLAFGTAGNLSVRVGEQVAITPSGLPYERLTPEDVCIVNVDGRQVEGATEPSRELPLHLAVYRRTDAGAVVHTHPLHATALATAADELPAIHYLVAELGGALRVVAYATPGSDELAAATAAALADRSAALLANHGAITTGATLERAYTRSVTLEWLAALFLRASLLGRPRSLPDDEVARLVELVRDYGATPSR
jgi:L-fuculose-phosphate aldolase